MSNGREAGAGIGAAVGTVVGAYFGMPQLGFSIGWMAGGLIGGALDPPDDKITDMGAQAFPDYNTSLRGLTIPVLFGTNRVSSQIAWKHNLDPIRNEESTGGDKAGSGSGAKQVNVNYTYKVHMICHLGFVSTPYAVYGGWASGDRISDTSIAAIQKNYADDFLTAASIFTTDPNAAKDLTFDEARFYPGNIPESNAWATFSGITGLDCRWPGTVWFGFGGLSLGKTTSLPQLSWEVGPVTDTNLDWQTTFVNAALTNSPTNLTYGNVTGMDSAGNVHISDNSKLRLFTTNGTVLSWTTSQIWTLIYNDPGLNWKGDYRSFPLGTTTPEPSYAGARFIPDTDRILYVGVAAVDGFRAGRRVVAVLRYDTLGNLTVTGGVYQDIGYFGPPGPDALQHARYLDQDWYGDPLVVGANGYSGQFYFLLLPSIGQMEGVLKGAKIDRCDVKVSDYVSGTSYFAEKGNITNATRFNQLFFHLPYLDMARGQTGFYIATYLNAIVAGRASSYGATWYDTWRAANPNGGLIFVNISNALLYVPQSVIAFGTSSVNRFAPDPFASGITVAAAATPEGYPIFKATDGSRYGYFDDDNSFYDTGVLREAGSTNGDGYYNWAHVENNPNGTCTVIFYYPVKNDPTYVAGTDWTTKVRVRVYTWNPMVGSLNEVVKAKGPVFTPANLGVSNTSLDRWICDGIIFDIQGRQLLMAGFNHAGGASNVLGPHYAWRAYFGTFDLSGMADMYPPEIIREILVNQYFGVYAGQDIIDSASYTVAYDYCRDNDIKVSTIYKSDQAAQRVIELLLATYSGYLTVDASLGRVKFGIQDLNRQPVRTLDNSHLIRRGESLPVRTTKGARQDTFNLIRIQYLDRALEYKMNSIEEADEVDQDYNGVRLREFPPQFVMEEALARKMAVRGLWDNLYTRDTHTFHLGWKDCDLEPGDVITLVDSFSGLNQVCRLTRMKEIERGVFETNAVQQWMYIPGLPPSTVSSATWAAINGSGVYSSYTNSIAYSGGPAAGTLASPSAPSAMVAYELPPEFSTLPYIYFGWMAEGTAAGANLYISPDGSTYSFADTAPVYQIAGRVRNALPSSGPPLLRDVDIDLMTGPTWSVNSPTYSQGATLTDVTQAAMHVGFGLLWVNDEVLAYSGVTLVSSNRYRLDRVYRGWGGTPVTSVAAGAQFYRHGAGMFSRGYTTNQIGNTIHYKIVPIAFNGAAYSVASAPAQTYTIRGEYYRPPLAGAIDFHQSDFANAGGRGTLKGGVGGDADIRLTWKKGARGSGFGYGGAGTNPGGWGAFTADAASTSWKVAVYNTASGTVVRTTSVNTPAFQYTAAQNSGDNGAWTGSLTVRVTPYNIYGEARAPSIAILELF